MPRSDSHLDLGNKDQIILFGGSFDPPHNGHADCVALAKEKFPHAQIWIIPAQTPATAKGISGKKPQLTFEERVNLCKLVFLEESKANKSILISEIEKIADQPNYTLSTLIKIKDENPEAKIFFLIGQDQLEVFSKWHEPRKILEIASLIVASRSLQNFNDGAESNDTDHTESDIRDCAKNTFAELGLALEWSAILDEPDENTADENTADENTADENTADENTAKIEGTDNSLYILPPLQNLAASSKIWKLIETDQKIPESWLSPELINKLQISHKIYKKGTT